MGAPRVGRSRRPLALGAPCVALVALAVFCAAAQAATGPKIRELYPGSVADPAAEYVELQMTASGQGALMGQQLAFYDEDAALVRTYTIPADVTHGESQRAVLLATTAAASGLGIPAPDFSLGSQAALSPAGGAVCLLGGASPDCVAWGDFPLTTPLEPSPLADPQSANAAAITDGMALRRTIARGCATELDEADDSGNSATDFEEASPGPHNNSEAPVGAPCPPDTVIQTFPRNPTNSTVAAFTYAALPQEEGGISFQCSLDGSAFSDCTAGASRTYTGLTDGDHTFRVYAEGPGGPDLTPASYSFSVDTTPPETFIDSGPPEPSGGFSATFTFHSSEANSGFRCQLDGGPAQSCAGSKTYINLRSGTHVFSVYAIDNAGNADPTPAARAFRVDNSIEDHTPPDTTIVSAPHNPSSSDGASFTYKSTEPGSSFECDLDGSAFSPCAATGISYGRLKNGRHSFQVRATDRAGNVDPVPAGYSWTVAAPLPRVRFARAPRGHVKLRGNRKRVTVRFKLKASKPGSSFRCRLDHQRFHLCRANIRFRVGAGKHRFVAYAVDALGNRGTAKARRIFRVQARRKRRFF